MPRKSAGRTHEQLDAENKDLRTRLDEAEDALSTIGSGEWDALVVSGMGGEQIITLKQSELRYRRLFEAAQDGILILDAETGMIEDVNPYLIKMLGYSRKEFVKKKLWQIGAFKDIEASEATFEALLANEYIRYEDLPLRTKDGRLVQVEFVSNVYLVDNEKVVQCNIRDITERKRAEARIQRQLEHLKSLRVIDMAITSSFNLGLTLDIVLDQVIAQLHTDAAAILLFHPVTRTLEYGASRGFRSLAIREARVRLGEGYAGKAILERRTIHILNLMGTDSEFSRALLLNDEDFNDYYCVPLIVKGEVKGVLEIFHRSVLAGDAEWLDFLETLAGQTAIAIQDVTLFESLQASNRELFQAYDATIEGWSHALDLRDKETEGHSLRVTEMTVDLARKFGLADQQLIYIRWGALLHDIGKMGIPDNILLKPHKLTDEEWERMKQHPVFALKMLAPITYLKSSLDIPYCHHEKWDGTGYPRGLKGAQIPLAARIFAVVDVWDALNSDRPYRPRWPEEKVVEHIRALSGTHFDPQVVDVFMQMPKKESDAVNRTSRLVIHGIRED